MTIRIFLSLIFFGCLFAACKKEVKAKDLKGTKWKLISIKSPGGLESWYYPARPKCELDNILEFQDGNVLKLYDEGEVCNPSQTSTSTWVIDNGRIYFGGAPNFVNSGQHTFDSFEDDQLVLRNTYTQNVFVYSRQ